MNTTAKILFVLAALGCGSRPVTVPQPADSGPICPAGGTPLLCSEGCPAGCFCWLCTPGERSGDLVCTGLLSS
jgi:hypothetical protein